MASFLGPGSEADAEAEAEAEAEADPTAVEDRAGEGEAAEGEADEGEAGAGTGRVPDAAKRALALPSFTTMDTVIRLFDDSS